MPELSQAAQRLLAAQKSRYLASLPEKAQQLNALADDRAALTDAAHKIAGSSGLHGLDQVQADAVALEEALKTGQTDEQVRGCLQALVGTLAIAADEGQDSK